MKTLFLMRHAKSSWKHAELNDLDRPLLEKGLKRTRTIIEYFLNNDVKIELIICSHALRSADTARIIARAFNVGENNFRIEKGVYTADADLLADQLYDLPESVSNVMIVGHNPAITNLANKFLNEKTDYLPTSGVVAVDFDTNDWDELLSVDFTTRFTIFPKML